MPKDPMFYSNHGSGPDSIIIAGDADHARIRRHFSHAFSHRALEEQQEIVKEHVDLLIERLRERDGQEVDMVAWYNWTTFDTVGL
jgi:cytochrome P450